MRILLLISSFLIWFSSYCRTNLIYDKWIAGGNEILITENPADKDYNAWISDGRENKGMFFYLKGDTLDFQDRYSMSNAKYSFLPVTDKYDLKIIKQTDSFMLVEPVSGFSRKFFKDKKIIKFTRQEFAVDKSIKLEKVVFNSSGCYGACPIYHLEIDSNKLVKFEAVEVFDSLHKNGYQSLMPGLYNDTTKRGFFTGLLTDSVYNRLVFLLRTCNLNTLYFNEGDGFDGSIKTIIVYYNGQCKYLKEMIPPLISVDLINCLYSVCEKSNLKRVEEKFTIEE